MIAIPDRHMQPCLALVYRDDNSFWATFYLSNGFNCRCLVVALDSRDIERRNQVAGENTKRNLIKTDKVYNKARDTYKTTAYQTQDRTLFTTDTGFDYNAGQVNYHPNLDYNDRKLAQQFSRSGMSRAEFRVTLKQFHSQIKRVDNHDLITPIRVKPLFAISYQTN